MEPQPCPFEKIHPSELHRDADYFMTHAYNEAIEAWKKDEVMTGTLAPAHHTSWVEALDDSLESYLQE